MTSQITKGVINFLKYIPKALFWFFVILLIWTVIGRAIGYFTNEFTNRRPIDNLNLESPKDGLA